MDQAVEHLPSKHEDLSSNPRTTKKDEIAQCPQKSAVFFKA
jgi:hypothetical protein